MTEEHLTEIEWRAQQATPGPWYAIATDDELCQGATYVGTQPRGHKSEGILDETTGEIIGKGCFVDGNRHKKRLMAGGVPAESVIAITTLQYPPLADAELLNENAIFIAAARTDVPLLIAEVRRLQALLSEAQKGPKENPPTWEGLL